MATRGWDGVTATDIARMQRKSSPEAKPSKYRNVKVIVDNQRFDSKAEADYWLWLRGREASGHIRNLLRQVRFALMCPDRHNKGVSLLVSEYIADFVYEEQTEPAFGVTAITWQRHIVDKKGKRTPMYLLKRKWLELQEGIIIEEV